MDRFLHNDIKIIPKNDLQAYNYYKGEGRCGHVAYWDGKHFYSITQSCGYYEAACMDYGEQGFDPTELITRLGTLK